MKLPESTTPLMPEAGGTEASTSSYGATSPQSATGGLGDAVQKHIGNLLKVSYQELLTEPVPDRFANLLEQLEQAEKKGK